MSDQCILLDDSRSWELTGIVQGTDHLYSIFSFRFYVRVPHLGLGLTQISIIAQGIAIGGNSGSARRRRNLFTFGIIFFTFCRDVYGSRNVVTVYTLVW